MNQAALFHQLICHDVSHLEPANHGLKSDTMSQKSLSSSESLDPGYYIPVMVKLTDTSSTHTPPEPSMQRTLGGSCFFNTKFEPLETKCQPRCCPSCTAAAELGTKTCHPTLRKSGQLRTLSPSSNLFRHHIHSVPVDHQHQRWVLRRRGRRCDLISKRLLQDDHLQPWGISKSPAVAISLENHLRFQARRILFCTLAHTGGGEDPGSLELLSSPALDTGPKVEWGLCASPALTWLERLHMTWL
ncbi:uncharacterized protein LOC104857681 [Fukomys damarensis]|uniref:uncharacterized protein LOC104857681 n=1 Tax=Fukomys damarensis TaxID=885580 RepID=UPI00053F3510|nr:uncharacterized protein LOC104857681 [Fukomys damarensis]